MQSVAANKAFKDKFEFPFELLSDQDRSLSLAFGAVQTTKDQYAERYTFVIDVDGMIEQAIATKNAGEQAAQLLM